MIIVHGIKKQSKTPATLKAYVFYQMVFVCRFVIKKNQTEELLFDSKSL